MMVNSHVLARTPLFASLDEASLSEIARRFSSRSVSSGTELAGEGASGYSFYVLADGHGTVSSRGATLAELAPGDFFGEAAIVGDGRRHATVTIDRAVRSARDVRNRVPPPPAGASRRRSADRETARPRLAVAE